MFRVNHNFGGKDVLHVESGCNLADADKVEVVDDLTAAALLDMDAVIPCDECKPLVDTDAGVS